MFLTHKIQSIRPGDRVLEIGPGNKPHPRSDVLLERCFSNDEALQQRGGTPELSTSKPIVFYDGGVFPFADGEFDYVICSHVLEHVADIDFFCRQIFRVGHKGYIEFPTVYYEYLYNFSVHTQLLRFNDGVLYHMPKKTSGLSAFQSIQNLFYDSLECGYADLVYDLKHVMFQGTEWLTPFHVSQAESIDQLTDSGIRLKALPRAARLARQLTRIAP